MTFTHTRVVLLNVFVVVTFFIAMPVLAVHAQSSSSLSCGADIDLGEVSSLWGKTVGATDYSQMGAYTECHITFLEPGSSVVNYNGDQISIVIGEYISGLTKADVQNPSNPNSAFVFTEKGNSFTRVEFRNEADRTKSTAIANLVLEKNNTVGETQLDTFTSRETSSESLMSEAFPVWWIVGGGLVLLLLCVLWMLYGKSKIQPHQDSGILPPQA